MLILIIPLFINHTFNLGLKKSILIATLRMVVQLSLVGFYLNVLFTLNNVWLNIIWLLLMLVLGASAILDSTFLNRSKRPTKILFIPVLTGLVLGLLPLMSLIIFIVLKPTPWYSAQYLIPLSGMLLGNSLSGNIVALQRLFTSFKDNNDQYEMALALAASPKVAARPFIEKALQQSLAPIIASMTTTGLITLPGMMTGQILAGVSPLEAIKYQLLIMVAIFVMLCLSVTMTLTLAIRSVLTTSGLITVKVG